ncbi:CENP-B homolog protein 2-like protein [Tanacetum coccineum]
MTDEIRRALCKHNKDNPSLTQKQLQEWVHSNYGLQVSQATISNTVKRSLEYLSLAPERGDVKRHKPAKFPDLEKSLYEWILQYQEHVNMTGELIIEKAKKFMKDMYPVDTPYFTFSIDNMTFENSDEGGESTQELQNLIKELGYRNAMDVEDVLTHPEENVVAQLLTDEEIIESVIGINKDDIDEEDDESSTMEPPSRNEAIKAAITLNNFLLSYEKTTPEVLTMLRKIRDEIQGEIDFNKKQKTIESFFKKPS